MKQFTSVKDIPSIKLFVKKALELKANPYAFQHLGKNKTLALMFMNPSLRTRLSAQKAAFNLGMNVMVMNMDKESWALETQDGVVMNGNTVEHIREAAAVIGRYCDILGLRSFPKLERKEEDYSETFFNSFVKFCGVPALNLESATRHPLQSFADIITIQETWKATAKPKVVLAWAPHIKALPQAVPNSFAEWMCKAQTEGMIDFTIAQPKGYQLADEFTQGAVICQDINQAISGADYIYVKNWSSYHNYGKALNYPDGWMMNNEKLKLTNNAKVMHCLPVRRDLELSSEILDSPNSLVIRQADNRLWSAQTVLKAMLENL